MGELARKPHIKVSIKDPNLLLHAFHSGFISNTSRFPYSKSSLTSAKYDHSGRSTGTAFITYKSTTDAIEAKNEYHGAKAKGATISIAFDQFTPRHQGANGRGGAPPARGGGRGGARGGAAGGHQSGNGDSLLGRLSGKDLLTRLGGEG